MSIAYTMSIRSLSGSLIHSITLNLSWEKMGKFKEFGGMSLKDLKAFNLALWLKQAWRILVGTRILGIKSFFKPGTYLIPCICLYLTAVELMHPSFGKVSVKELDLSKKGIWMRVGDGIDIKVWYDPWFPRLFNFKNQWGTTKSLHPVYESQIFFQETQGDGMFLF